MSFRGMKMTPINEIIRLHKRYGLPHLRLGQFFVSRYIKGTWPNLFYEKDDKVSLYTIEGWLKDHHYYNELPIPVHKIEDQLWFKEKQDDG